MDQFIHPLIATANECLKEKKWEEAKEAYNMLLSSDAPESIKSIARKQLNQMGFYEKSSTVVPKQLQDLFPGLSVGIMNIGDIITSGKIREIIPRNDADTKTLEEDIKMFGIKSPVIVNKEGLLIDGYCRYDIIKELKLLYIPAVIVDIPGNEAIQWAIKLNTIRRQMSKETRQKFIEKILEWQGGIKKGRPTSNDNLDKLKIKDIADTLGINKRTVHKDKTEKRCPRAPFDKMSKPSSKKSTLPDSVADKFVDTLKVGSKKSKYVIDLEFDIDSLDIEKDVIKCISEIVDNAQLDTDYKKIKLSINVELK